MLQFLVLFLHGNFITVVATHEIMEWNLMVAYLLKVYIQNTNLSSNCHKSASKTPLWWFTYGILERNILLLPTVLIGEEVPLNKKLGSCRDHYGIKNAKL